MHETLGRFYSTIKTVIFLLMRCLPLNVYRFAQTGSHVREKVDAPAASADAVRVCVRTVGPVGVSSGGVTVVRAEGPSVTEARHASWREGDLCSRVGK